MNLDFSQVFDLATALAKHAPFPLPYIFELNPECGTMDSHNDILEGCPFPEVAKSLGSYIKTRQEVGQIRRELQSTLPVSSVNVLQPGPDVGADLASLSGVRKAYWRALQAHQAAQRKYDALKSELKDLAQNGPSTAASTEDSLAYLTESHIPLMRQREKLRKLKVIESTCARINANGGEAVGESFDRVAKREVGDLPVPPSSTTFGDRDAGFDSEFNLIQLKKAILSTKQALDNHEKTISEQEGLSADTVDPLADLRALQRTHEELTIWMETQLAAISGVEGTKEEAANGAPQTVDSNGTAAHAVKEIEDLYELYVGARQRLLETVAKAPSRNLDLSRSSDLVRRKSESNETDSRCVPSVALLPYLPDLLAAKDREQSLLQQGTFTRRQLSSAEQQSHALITRLADESHILQPDLSRGPPRGKDWVTAGKQASDSVAAIASKRIRSGDSSAAAAQETLQAIQAMPDLLDSLLK